MDNSIFNNYENKYLKLFIIKSLRREIICFYIKQIIFINRSKFKANYLLPLTSLIEKFYKKKIEFNLVNLKYLYLNSYIFTDTIVKKIKLRKRSFLHVLKKSLMFKMPPINRLAILDEMYNKKKTPQNLKVHHILYNLNYSKQKGMEIETAASASASASASDAAASEAEENINSYGDNLDLILKKKLEVKQEGWKTLEKILNYSAFNSDLLSKKDNKKFKKFKLQDKKIVYYNMIQKGLTKTVLDSIKYKFVKGIRIEAAGRLTRRYTAAKALFKKVYIGNIQNMDSSFKGLSTVVLRGHFRSNLQYTKLCSRRRIGAFGIKGWVSSSN